MKGLELSCCHLTAQIEVFRHFVPIVPFCFVCNVFWPLHPRNLLGRLLLGSEMSPETSPLPGLEFTAKFDVLAPLP